MRTDPAIITSRGPTEQPPVLLLVEPEQDARPGDEDRSPDETGLLEHQVERLFLRRGQRAFLEDRAALAEEIRQAAPVDVRLEELARRRVLEDVPELDVDADLLQKTSGVSARRSGGLAEERGLAHRVLPPSGRHTGIVHGRASAPPVSGRPGAPGGGARTLDYNTGEC
jgi:hypothetical protein